MKKSDLEKLKQVLQEQLHSLQTDFGQLEKTPSVTNNSNIADVNDQATLESERSFEIRIRDRERKLISKVRGALDKIEEGSYGVCESCGEEIGLKRLLARPVTTYCINCKSEMEAEEKREESILGTRGHSADQSV